MKKIDTFIRFLVVVLIAYGSIVLTSSTTTSTTTSSTDTTATTATNDTYLQAVVTASSSLQALENDPQNRMTNYIKTHVRSAAKRLGTICSVADMTVSGDVQPSDKTIVLGVHNVTQDVFNIFQDETLIGQVQPGWNGDVVLNLCALSSGLTATSGALPSFTFVPSRRSKLKTQLMVRVMTGAQLTTHVNNITSQETTVLQSQTAFSQDVVTLHQNGTNAIQEFTAEDVYVVIENDFLKPNSILELLTKRIQVVNLSNITDMCTISLTLNTLNRFVSDGVYERKKGAYVQFDDVAIISFQSFHMIDKVQTHHMPLMLLPRSVYMAGSSMGSAYAKYIQTYSQALGNANAGSGAVYYDLAMQYSCEPFEYLRLLGYFDVNNVLYPVVDQAMSVASGTTLGSYIFTDVLGSYVTSAAQDVSWVVAKSNTSLSSKYENLVVSFTPSLQENSKTDIGGLFGRLYHTHNASNAPTSTTTQMAQYSSDSFPITQLSQDLLCPNSTFTLDFFTSTGSFTGLTCDWFVGDPLLLQAGNKFDKPSSLQSWWWNMDQELWSRGIKLVPVYYDVTTCSPFVDQESFDVVNENKKSILYFYAYRPSSESYLKDTFLGLVPVLFQFGSEMQLDVATKWVTVARRSITQWGPTAKWQAAQFNTYSYQSPEYDNGAVAFPGQHNLINKGTCSFEYPGFGYLAVNFAHGYPVFTSLGVTQLNVMYTVQNKMKQFSDLVALINSTWSIPNPASYSWTIPVSKVDMSKGVDVRAEKVHKNTYHVTVRDAGGKIMYAQRMYVDVPQDTNVVVAALHADGTLSTYGTVSLVDHPKGVAVQLKASPISAFVMHEIQDTKQAIASKKSAYVESTNVYAKKAKSQKTKTTKKAVATK